MGNYESMTLTTIRCLPCWKGYW